MRKYKHNGWQSGFTLLELMAVVAVGGILLAIGLPAFGSFIKSSRITTQTNSLITALHLARNEAINRGHDIRVLSLSDSTDWASGWEVRLDVNNNGVTDSGATVDIVLRNFDAIKNATLLGATKSVTYESSGFVTAVNTLTLRASECTAVDVRIIAVKLSGLVNSTKQAC